MTTLGFPSGAWTLLHCPKKFPAVHLSAFVFLSDHLYSKMSLTCREIIANRKIGRRIWPSILQPIRTELRRTTHGLRISPNDLRKVSPGAEGAGVDGIAAVRTGVFGHFSIVHGVCEHEGDLARCEAGADILAVVAVAGSAGGKGQLLAS